MPKKIAKKIGTRTVQQVRSHLQKYVSKLKKEKGMTLDSVLLGEGGLYNDVDLELSDDSEDQPEEGQD